METFSQAACKDIGKMINKMDMVKKFGLMVVYMKENIKMEKKMVQGNLNGVMEVYMKENFLIII